MAKRINYTVLHNEAFKKAFAAEALDTKDRKSDAHSRGKRRQQDSNAKITENKL